MTSNTPTLHLYKVYFGSRPVYYAAPCSRNSMQRLGKYVLIWCEDTGTWMSYCGGNLIDNPELRMWVSDEFVGRFTGVSRLELLVNTGFTINRLRKLIELYTELFR